MSADGEVKTTKIDGLELEFFSAAFHSLEIAQLAAGLSEEEILQYYNVEKDELGEDDQKFLTMCFNRGRATGLNHAVQKLIENFTGRNGHQACLAYLGNFSGGWSESAESVKGMGGKTFRFIVE